MAAVRDVINRTERQWLFRNLGDARLNAIAEAIERNDWSAALQSIMMRRLEAQGDGDTGMVNRLDQVRRQIRNYMDRAPTQRQELGGNGGNGNGGNGGSGSNLTTTPDWQPTGGGGSGGFWDNLPDIIGEIGDLFGGGGNGGGGDSPFNWQPANGGGSGGNGNGGPPAVIAQLPSGIKNILDNAVDIADLVSNPSVVNFLKAIDPTTANQILQYFGISGSVSDLTSQDSQQTPTTTGGNGMMGSFAMEMMTDSITSKSGKAIFQAMQGGTLQSRGVWFPAQPTQTPRGTEYISPPGYVTVRVSGEPYSVLRPIAKTMFGYESDPSSSTLQKADKAVRKLKKYEKDIKKILPKLGYTKSPDRLKSGPRR